MRHQTDPNRSRVEMRSQDYGILRGRQTPPPSIAPIVAEGRAANIARNRHFGNAIYQCGSHEAAVLAE
jgi:hypothetical protein